MTTDNIKKYESELLELRDRLSREIKEVIKDTDMGSDVSSPSGHEADEAEERGIAYAEQITLKERLTAVLDALEKIKKGTYGVCEKCQGVIGADVLAASPESRLCRECKAAKE